MVLSGVSKTYLKITVSVKRIDWRKYDGKDYKKKQREGDDDKEEDGHEEKEDNGET